ncbi:replication protein RepA, partial [Pseudarthrobacter phenanthrenivorans]|uniref:replication protein RepA n=2 Tax=cellular organisms TaxID=131567 RepID=UPI00344E3409
AAPVPVYTAALKALSGSPLRMDLYVWLAYRMATLRGPVTITWAQLAGQFGGEYAQLRQFKAKLIKHLDAVRVVYPRARVAVTDAGLRLHPSATHVARKRKKALRRSA